METRRGKRREKKLLEPRYLPICISTSVSHGQDSSPSVFQLEILVLEFLAVNGSSAGSIVPREITTLAHEVGDDTMEGTTFVTEAFLAGT